MFNWVPNTPLDMQLGRECHTFMREAFEKIVNYFYKKVSA